jgi:hypothetical protein
MTKTLKKSAILTVMTGALCLLVAAPPAEAATQRQDGLVNVAVGDITLNRAVAVGIGAQVAAQICGVKVGPVAVLGTAVDATGQPATVCTSGQGPVTLTQN